MSSKTYTTYTTHIETYTISTSSKKLWEKGGHKRLYISVAVDKSGHTYIDHSKAVAGILEATLDWYIDLHTMTVCHREIPRKAELEGGRIKTYITERMGEIVAAIVESPKTVETVESIPYHERMSESDAEDMGDICRWWDSKAASEAPEAVVEVPEAVVEVPEAVVEVPEAVVEAPEAIVEAPEAIVEAPDEVMSWDEADAYIDAYVRSVSSDKIVVADLELGYIEDHIYADDGWYHPNIAILKSGLVCTYDIPDAHILNEVGEPYIHEMTKKRLDEVIAKRLYVVDAKEMSQRVSTCLKNDIEHNFVKLFGDVPLVKIVCKTSGYVEMTKDELVEEAYIYLSETFPETYKGISKYLQKTYVEYAPVQEIFEKN